MNEEMIKEIRGLKKEKNAVLLVHNYQRPEIQDIADILGDSLDLSRKALETDKDVIVFCGVRFMAETAKILSPYKKVLLPVYEAGCPMADMVTPDELIEFKKKNPEYKIVTYVNTTAEVKAESDICITSANAVKVISDYPHNKLLLIPDRNLGNYIKSKVKDKEIMLWEGYCPVHIEINLNELRMLKDEYPDAVFLAHPECEEVILNKADHIMSTNQMIKYVKESDEKVFLIGTEQGIIYRMKKENPKKEIYPAGKFINCPNMKKTDLSDVLNALKYDQYEITLPDNIITRARTALDEMLKYS
ncbi:MAG: quinolinate synthase NadA [Spirochaetes bacterium]|nr:quinolinate synthase NadA [Spirochaetota bacterium]